MRVSRRHALSMVVALAAGTGCAFDTAGRDEDPTPGGAVDASIPPADVDARPADPSADAALPCPPGWIEAGARCYLVAADALTWADAQVACQAQGGDLVVLEDADENLQVSALAAARSTWWIGATDAAAEGTWRWIDGREADFDAWALFQPDNFFNEDCALQSSSGSWNDAGCEEALAYVCERAAR